MSQTKKTATMDNTAPIKKKSTTPSYSVMINHAIKALNDRKGSSRAAIHNYLSEHYEIAAKTPKRVNTSLRAALKKGLESGKLILVSGNGIAGRFSLSKENSDAKPKAISNSKENGPISKKAATVKKTTAAKKPTINKKPMVSDVKEKPATKVKPAIRKRSAATTDKHPVTKKSTVSNQKVAKDSKKEAAPKKTASATAKEPLDGKKAIVVDTKVTKAQSAKKVRGADKDVIVVTNATGAAPKVRRAASVVTAKPVIKIKKPMSMKSSPARPTKVMQPKKAQKSSTA